MLNKRSDSPYSSHSNFSFLGRVGARFFELRDLGGPSYNHRMQLLYLLVVRSPLQLGFAISLKERGQPFEGFGLPLAKLFRVDSMIQGALREGLLFLQLTVPESLWL